jgi:F420-non-reducing hydrogenase iron-sulfur subunit
MPELAGPPAAPPGGSGGRPKIVGFLCDWAVASDGLVDEKGEMRDVPGVTLIKIPCSGFTRPAWLDFALRNGAAGVFVCGCPIGDCFNRYGNNLIADRVEVQRRRSERQRINPERIGAIFYRRDAQHEFVAAVRAFAEKVAGLPGPVVPPARPAAPRAGAAAPKPAAPATEQEGT